MVMWTEFHPPTAPVTWPCLQPHPNLVCRLRHLPAIPALCYLGLMHIFWVFVFAPSLLTFCQSGAFCTRINIKAQSVVLCGLEFHLTHTWPGLGAVGLLVLSCCSQVKFMKSKQQVCFSCTGAMVSASDGHLLDSRSGDSAARRALVQITLMINLPLLCGCIRYDVAHNLSPWM